MTTYNLEDVGPASANSGRASRSKTKGAGAPPEDAHASLWEAFLAAQGEFQAVTKSKAGARATQKYAPLDVVLAAVLPALHKNGLVLTQPLTVLDDMLVVRTMLMHPASGETHECLYPAGPLTLGHQQLGGGVTYARRYSVLSLLGIAPEDEDDDGQSAGAAGARPQPTSSRQDRGTGSPSRAPAEDVRPSAMGFIEQSTRLIRSAMDLDSAEEFYTEVTSKPGYGSLNEAERNVIWQAISQMRRVLTPDDE